MWTWAFGVYSYYPVVPLYQMTRNGMTQDYTDAAEADFQDSKRAVMPV